MKPSNLKSWLFASSLLALTLAAPPVAQADYAVVQFDDGYCRIWWDSAGTPWGTGWTKLAMGLPDHFAAEAALDSAISQQLCH